MRRNSPLYTVVFTFVVCAVCSVLVSGTFVALAERQRIDAAYARMGEILVLAGLAEEDEELDRETVRARFEDVEVLAVDLRTRTLDPEIDGELFDQRDASQDPSQSFIAPQNDAGVRRLPSHAILYQINAPGGGVDQVLVPIHGQGYGGQIFGFLALDRDLITVRDIVFYEHQETPGLGARITRTAFRRNWPGRRVFDSDGNVALRLVRGAGPPEDDPYQVDGVSRASVTTAGVENMIHFWMGPDALGPFLAAYREKLADEKLAGT